MNIKSLEDVFEKELKEIVGDEPPSFHADELQRYFDKYVLSQSTYQRVDEFNQARTEDFPAITANAALIMGAYYARMTKRAESLSLPKPKLEKLNELASTYYVRGFKIAKKLIETSSPKRADTFWFARDILKHAEATKDKRIIMQFADIAINVARTAGVKKKNEAIIKEGLALAEEYNPQQVPYFESGIKFTVQDFVAAIRAYEANEPVLFESTPELRKASRIAQHLDQNTTFWFNRFNRGHDQETLSCLADFKRKHYDSLPDEFKRSFSRIYARVLWREVMSYKKNTGYWDYVLLAEGRDTSCGHYPNAHKHFKRRINRI